MKLPTHMRPSLFWDVDQKKLDSEKHARYIIERILEFGNDKEVKWLFRHYSRDLIGDTIRRSRGVLHEKTKALWTLVLQ